MPLRDREPTMNQIERFERWRKKLPPDSRLFVDLVLEQIVPLFTASGYVRLTEYGGKHYLDASAARTIVFQRQSGADWPTVELRFVDLGRPKLVVDFSLLPETCTRVDNGSPISIPRSNAIASEGHAYFRLMRNRRRSNDGIFGISTLWPWFRRQAKLYKEVSELRELCAWLIGRFSNGIPQQWTEKGTPSRVDKHAWRQYP